MSCAGYRLSGTASGAPCSARAPYEIRGKRYCGAHYAVAKHDPSRFRDAVEARAWRDARARTKAQDRARNLDWVSERDERGVL